MPLRSLADLHLDDLIRGAVHALARRLGGPGALLPHARPLLRRERERLPRQTTTSSTRARRPASSPPTPATPSQTAADAARWRDAGGRFCGGTLAGLRARSATCNASVSPPFGSARSSSRSPRRRATTATASRTSSRWTRASARARICASWWTRPTPTASTSYSTSSSTTPATSSTTTRTATARRPADSTRWDGAPYTCAAHRPRRDAPRCPSASST